MIGNAIAGFLGTGAAAVANSYESIQTTTVGAGGASSISFTSIPATYTHLQVRVLAQNIYTSIDIDDIRIRFNSDTAANYSYHLVRGNGATAISAAGSSTTSMIAPYSTAVNTTSSIFGVSVVDILDYANTNKYKTIRALGGSDQNGAGAVGLYSGSWRSTSAVTDINMFNLNGNWKQYSSFALYGIKG
jgi:hypothetical protein